MTPMRRFVSGRPSAREPGGSQGSRPRPHGCLQDANFLVRLDAIWALKEIGPEARAAVPARWRCSRTSAFRWMPLRRWPSWERRRRPCYSSGSCLTTRTSTIAGGRHCAGNRIGAKRRPPLRHSQACSKTGPGWFGMCGRGLGEAGRDGDSPPGSCETAQKPGCVRAGNAACELGNIGPAAKGGIGALADLLVDKDWEVRSAAARAMGQMGPDARAVAPALRRFGTTGTGRSAKRPSKP